jgi:hypothetical protein
MHIVYQRNMCITIETAGITLHTPPAWLLEIKPEWVRAVSQRCDPEACVPRCNVLITTYHDEISKNPATPCEQAKEHYRRLMLRWFGHPKLAPVHTAVPSVTAALASLPPLLFPWRYFPWSSWGAAVHARYDTLQRLRAQWTQKKSQYAALQAELYSCICASGSDDSALRVLLCSSVAKHGWQDFATEHLSEHLGYRCASAADCPMRSESMSAECS